MNNRFLSRLFAVFGLLCVAALGSSCSTYYDSYGYPRQTVDPGLAVAGVVAAGALGYALADSHDNRRRHYRRHDDHNYHRGHSRHQKRYYRRGSYRY
ncbi:MAG: hypothetical protein ACI9R3_001723 [Verrucomicrobiales bacterium]|jgi:hypothetical protein